jgi:UPF0755 protein
MYLNKKEKSKKLNIFQKIFVAILVVFVGFFVFTFFAISPPSGFPSGEVIEIERGAGLKQISNHLKEKNVIRFPRLFDALVIVFDGDKSIVAGDYSFERSMTSLEVARRIINGIHGIDSMRIVIPEGATLEEIANIYEKNLVNFDRNEFFVLTEDMEGFLFPDTYIFFATTKTSDVVNKMLDNFDSQVNPLMEDISKSGKTLNEIITMASIIQKEAYRNYLEKQTISGILWKRISINMRLQVDASLKYYTGRGSAQLTRADLTSDHPYNTYTRGGLPPGPIGAPSLNAIRAAIYPVQSPYLYYLHDNSGRVHYARNHDEHIRNKNSYLR